MNNKQELYSVVGCSVLSVSVFSVDMYLCYGTHGLNCSKVKVLRKQCFG